MCSLIRLSAKAKKALGVDYRKRFTTRTHRANTLLESAIVGFGGRGRGPVCASEYVTMQKEEESIAQRFPSLSNSSPPFTYSLNLCVLGGVQLTHTFTHIHRQTKQSNEETLNSVLYTRCLVHLTPCVCVSDVLKRGRANSALDPRGIIIYLFSLHSSLILYHTEELQENAPKL